MANTYAFKFPKLSFTNNRDAWADFINLAIISLAGGLLFFVGLGSYPFIDPGDGYYTEGSREMLLGHDFIVPHLNYQIYYSKPILIYWLICLAYKLFGVNEFAGRFWSALLALALAGCIYWTVRCLSNKRAGLWAGLIFATSPLVVTFARSALLDMTFSSLLGIALCALLMTVFAEDKRWWPVLYVALALATLTKGPAGLVTFGLGVVGYLIMQRPSRVLMQQWMHSLHIAYGLVLFSVIVLPWYIAVGLATKWLFIKVFFLYENLGRFAGQMNHRVPYFWFYIPVLLYGFFPWVLYLPAALGIPLLTKSRRIDQPLSQAKVFLVIWSAAIFLFFSLAATKLQTYILPCLAAFAMLVALQMDSWCTTTFDKPKYVSWVSKLLAVIGVLILVAAAMAVFLLWQPELIHYFVLTPGVEYIVKTVGGEAGFKAILGLAALILVIGWSAQCFRLAKHDGAGSFNLLLITYVMVLSLVAPALFVLGYKLKQKDVHDVVVSVSKNGGQIAIFQEFKPSLMFYAQQPIDSFFQPGQLVPQAANYLGPVQYVIASRRSLPLLIRACGNHFRLLFEQGKWGAYEAVGLHLQKLPTLEQTFVRNLNLNSGGYTWGTLPFAAGDLKNITPH